MCGERQKRRRYFVSRRKFRNFVEYYSRVRLMGPKMQFVVGIVFATLRHKQCIEYNYRVGQKQPNELTHAQLNEPEAKKNI